MDHLGELLAAMTRGKIVGCLLAQAWGEKVVHLVHCRDALDTDVENLFGCDDP